MPVLNFALHYLPTADCMSVSDDEIELVSAAGLETDRNSSGSPIDSTSTRASCSKSKQDPDLESDATALTAKNYYKNFFNERVQRNETKNGRNKLIYVGCCKLCVSIRSPLGKEITGSCSFTNFRSHVENNQTKLQI